MKQRRNISPLDTVIADRSSSPEHFRIWQAWTPKQHHGRIGRSSSRTRPQQLVTSSKDTLDWAAQQDTPMLTVDDIEAHFVEINPQENVALVELLEGEPLDIVQNSTGGAGSAAWRKLVRRWAGNERC